MAHRRQVRDNLYSNEDVDHATLTTLGGMSSEVYVVVRDDEDGTRSLVKLKRYPELFKPVYRADGVVVLQVNRRVCRERATESLSSAESGS